MSLRRMFDAHHVGVMAMCSALVSGAAVGPLNGAVPLSVVAPDSSAVATAAQPPAEPDGGLGWRSEAAVVAEMAPAVGDARAGVALAAAFDPSSRQAEGNGTTRELPQRGHDGCPEGMLAVEGDYYAVVGHTCRARLDGPVERCSEYVPPGVPEGRAEHKRFCVDRFEYPNLQGVRPVVMVSWMEARAACESEGKRLCTATEWTLACEGGERLPYPYGYRRDDTACNIDRPHATPNENALISPRSVSSEVARLDQRVASGEMDRCTSPYGVQDMTGNVDEWVVNEQHFEAPPADGSARPFISALKGGYWGPVRNRCRATTTAHNAWFRYYQVGFRCCADSP